MENQEQKPVPETPAISEQQPTKKAKPKWIIPVIVVVGIIVLGVGAWAGYNYWLKPDIPEDQSVEEQQESELDEFADWEIYRNEEYGFEFKYPKEWDFQADPPSVSNPFYLRFSKYDKAPEVLGPNMLATTNTKSDLDTLRESIESGETKEVIDETQEILWSTIKPINLDSKVVRFITGFYAPGGSFYQMVQFFIEKDLIQLWVNLPLDLVLQKDRDEDPRLTRRVIEQVGAGQVDAETLETIDIFNQVLSTFKFIEPDKIADCLEKYPEVVYKDCVPGEVIDGWRSIILYPDTLDTSNITHYIDAPAPDTVKQAGIASYGTSRSTCQTTWRIKINEEWKDVNRVDFCNFIIEYNSSCNDCLLEWEGGCC